MPPVFHGPKHDSTDEDTPHDRAPGRPQGPRLNWVLGVSEERVDSVLVLVVSGRLSTAEADNLQARIDRTVAAGDRRLVVDLAAVDYVGSRGIAVLEAAHARLEEGSGRLVLCALTDPVRISFELAGAVERLAVEDTRAAAVAAATRRPDTPSPRGRKTA